MCACVWVREREIYICEWIWAWIREMERGSSTKRKSIGFLFFALLFLVLPNNVLWFLIWVLFLKIGCGFSILWRKGCKDWTFMVFCVKVRSKSSLKKIFYFVQVMGFLRRYEDDGWSNWRNYAIGLKKFNFFDC